MLFCSAVAGSYVATASAQTLPAWARALGGFYLWTRVNRSSWEPRPTRRSALPWPPKCRLGKVVSLAEAESARRLPIDVSPPTVARFAATNNDHGYR